MLLVQEMLVVVLLLLLVLVLLLMHLLLLLVSCRGARGSLCHRVANNVLCAGARECRVDVP